MKIIAALFMAFIIFFSGCAASTWCFMIGACKISESKK